MDQQRRREASKWVRDIGVSAVIVPALLHWLNMPPPILVMAGIICLIVLKAWERLPATHESNRRKKMVVFVGMIVFGAAFLGCAGWYFWPGTKTEAPAVSSVGTPAPGVAKPKISFQKLALFWVRVDSDVYQLGAVIKLFNLDNDPHLINGIIFDRTAWKLVPRGSYYLRRYVENLDHAELIEDNYIKAGNEGYFKKLLPIKIDLTINGGDMPEFIIWGQWSLIFGDQRLQVEPPFYSVYGPPISEHEWDDLLKPKSKIDINNLSYTALGSPPGKPDETK